MSHVLAILAVLTLAPVGEASGPTAPPPVAPVASATPALDDARKQGWDIARIVVDVVSRRTDHSPGLTAFVEDFRRVDQQDAAARAGRVRVVDADVLVTRNASFWRATYEVAPADPAWLTLHAALLLSAGEALRARQIAAMAHLPGRVPDPYDRALSTLVNLAQRVIDEGSAVVDQGIAAFDAGRRDEAMKAYERALAAWPQNAMAHYEVGLCHMTDAIAVPSTRKERTKRKRDIAATLAVGESPFHSTGAADAFALSRRHDPLQWMAYQGTGDVVLQLKAMLGRVQPAWEKLRSTSFGKLDDPDLLELAGGLQEAQADELALVARQIIVLRRGRFAPEDHPFIATSLRRLAPGASTDATLARLAGEQLSVVQLAGPWPGAVR